MSFHLSKKNYYIFLSFLALSLCLVSFFCSSFFGLSLLSGSFAHVSGDLRLSVDIEGKH